MDKMERVDGSDSEYEEILREHIPKMPGSMEPEEILREIFPKCSKTGKRGSCDIYTPSVQL